jgi:hypothetical protein
MAAKTTAAKQSAEPTARLGRVVEGVLDGARARAARRVQRLRDQHPDEAPRQLGERLVRSSSFKAGLVGAATGALSIVSLPVGLPAGVAFTLASEAELLLSLLDLYGVDNAGTAGRARLYALWAGAGFADAAKSAGLRLGANALGRVLAGSLPARVIARLNPLLLRAILRRLGMGWVPRALKLWPLLGAPVGFALDRAALKALGLAAIGTLEEMAAAVPAPAPAKKRVRTRAPVVRRRTTRAR